jgi:putative protein kinase ArgK-like GTPase of G3E family
MRASHSERGVSFIAPLANYQEVRLIPGSALLGHRKRLAMNGTADFALFSLLQKRVEFARKSAASARSETVAKEFEGMADLYEEVLGRAGASAAAPAKPSVSRSDPKSDLVRILQSRAAEFLTKARTVTDKLRADELKYLAGAYGAEAARLKNEGMR